MDFPELEQLAGLLRHDEGMRLAKLAAEVPSGRCIVELGAFKGKSACYLARGSQRGNEVPVYSVDLWDAPTPAGAHREDRFEAEDVFAVYRAQIEAAEVGALVSPIRGATADTGRKWRGPMVGLLLIDADHSYAGAVDDYEAWQRLIPSGGVLAFHDYNRNVPDVIRAVERHVRPTGLWDVLPRVRHLWTARRR